MIFKSFQTTSNSQINSNQKIMGNLTQDQSFKYLQAKRRARDLRILYSITIVYCMLVPFWIVLNHYTNPEFQWFWFPVTGGGISILILALDIFAGKKWEEKKIKELMEKAKILI